MTRRGRLALHVSKEIHELSLAWLLSLFAIVAGGLNGEGEALGIGMLAYALGTSTLGGLSIGHEYNHRTISLILSQPARRAELLLVKLAVLAAMLLALAAIAGMLDLFEALAADVGWESGRGRAFLWLPLLCGLFVAPWLTMISRSPIAGAIFGASVPGVVMTAGGVVGVMRYGFTPEVDVLALGLVVPGTLALCALGAVMTWRTFLRLEAIDDRGLEIDVPRWLHEWTGSNRAVPGFTRRHPTWLLAAKELRLQRMALIPGGLYVFGWIVVALLHDEKLSDIFEVLTVIYVLLVSLLIGSLASAEERQLGTLEWQMLLPMPAAKQWAIKVGMATGLALLLALGLPTLLLGLPLDRLVQSAAFVVLVTAAGLYVSSISASGLMALMVSLSAVFATMLALMALIRSSDSAVLLAVSRVVFRITPLGLGQSSQRLVDVLEWLAAAAPVAVALGFGLRNHRSAERSGRCVLAQGIWIAGTLAAGVTLLGVAAYTLSH